MHAFDYAYLRAIRSMSDANEGERIVTLDEKEFTLNSSNLVICDGGKAGCTGWYHGRSELRDQGHDNGSHV